MDACTSLVVANTFLSYRCRVQQRHSRRYSHAQSQRLTRRTGAPRLVDSLEKPEEAGKVIPVGGPDVLTYRQIAVLAAGAAGVDRPRSAFTRLRWPQFKKSVLTVQGAVRAGCHLLGPSECLFIIGRSPAEETQCTLRMLSTNITMHTVGSRSADEPAPGIVQISGSPPVGPDCSSRSFRLAILHMGRRRAAARLCAVFAHSVAVRRGRRVLWEEAAGGLLSRAGCKQRRWGWVCREACGACRQW